MSKRSRTASFAAKKKAAKLANKLNALNTLKYDESLAGIYLVKDGKVNENNKNLALKSIEDVRDRHDAADWIRSEQYAGRNVTAKRLLSHMQYGVSHSDSNSGLKVRNTIAGREAMLTNMGTTMEEVADINDIPLIELNNPQNWIMVKGRQYFKYNDRYYRLTFNYEGDNALEEVPSVMYLVE